VIKWPSKDRTDEILRQLARGYGSHPREPLFSPDLDTSPEFPYSVPDAGPPIAQKPGHVFSSTKWANPREAIDSLQSYGDDEIATLVGKKFGLPAESAQLQAIIGDKYAYYRKMWLTEVRVLRELAAEQKREEARREREVERQRDEMRRYEHPVEVP
jgi:hypothetical protein